MLILNVIEQTRRANAGHSPVIEVMTKQVQSDGRVLKVAGCENGVCEQFVAPMQFVGPNQHIIRLITQEKSPLSLIERLKANLEPVPARPKPKPRPPYQPSPSRLKKTLKRQRAAILKKERKAKKQNGRVTRRK